MSTTGGRSASAAPQSHLQWLEMGNRVRGVSVARDGLSGLAACEHIGVPVVASLASSAPIRADHERLCHGEGSDRADQLGELAACRQPERERELPITRFRRTFCV